MHSRPVSRALTSTAVALTLLGLSGGSAGALEPTGSPGSAGSGDSILPAWGNGGYDARHYDIDLSWRADSRTVDARTTVTAVATQNLSRFNLELRGFAVDGVTVKVGDVRQPATVRRDGAEMTVDPPVDIAKGQTFRTTVSYSGKPSARVIKHLGKTGWLSTSDGATALSEPLGSETWFPVNNTIRDKATYAIDVEVPNRLMAASNGRFAGRDVGDTRTTWKWREADPMAPYLPTVSIGRYRMFRSAMDHGRIPLVTFVDTKLGRQAEARRTLPRVIRFLERTFGRYPFQSSGMVIDRIDVGYALETQSRPVMPFRAPSYLITHEIAHQWVGNSVTPRDWKDIWLNEGFATYTEWLWDAERFDKPATPQRQFDFLYEIYGPKSSFWETPPANPGSVNKLFALPVYNRGAMALQALRMRIGSHDFRTVLHRWAQQNAGRTVTTGDFKTLAERVSGRQLDGLFRTWLYVPEKPKGY